MFIAGARRWQHHEPIPFLPARIILPQSHTVLPMPLSPAVLQIRADHCRWLPPRGWGRALHEPSVPWLWLQGGDCAIIRHSSGLRTFLVLPLTSGEGLALEMCRAAGELWCQWGLLFGTCP